MQILKVVTGAIVALAVADMLILGVALYQIGGGEEVYLNSFWRWQAERVVRLWNEIPVSIAEGTER